MSAQATSVLLEGDDEIAIAGGIFYFARLFGRQLADAISEHYAGSAPDWFKQIKLDRQRNGEPTYDDPADPRFLLSEVAGLRAGVPDAIPKFDNRWKNQADALRRKLNNWFHNSLEPNLATYIAIVGMIRELSAQSALPLTKSAVQAEQRAKAILAKAYAPAAILPTPSVAIATVSAEDASATRRMIDKVKSIEKRPPIGGEWTGEPGHRRIRISRQTRDVTENGVSIRSQLGSDPEGVVDSWLRYIPERQSGEALIADDGAVMAFRKGQAYLIGWLGGEPEPMQPAQGILQGFALPYSYIFTGDDVREVTSNKYLSRSAPEKTKNLISQLGEHLEAEQMFEATQYGELFKTDAEGNPELLATAHKGIWFPGHLPG